MGEAVSKHSPLSAGGRRRRRICLRAYKICLRVIFTSRLQRVELIDHRPPDPPRPHPPIVTHRHPPLAAASFSTLLVVLISVLSGRYSYSFPASIANFSPAVSDFPRLLLSLHSSHTSALSMSSSPRFFFPLCAVVSLTLLHPDSLLSLPLRSSF